MIKEIKLLNHQYEILSDTTTKTIGMISGYGGGKTYTACRKAIQLSYLNIGFTGIMTEPTFDMIRNILIPEMKKALFEWNIDYKLNLSTATFYLNINNTETKILCLSAENYERLVGINAAWAIMDEADTSKMEIAQKAYQKILGRIRDGNVRQICIFSTPEGFKFCYNLFVTNATSSTKLVRAKTTDNKYLPLDFIETLKQQYPENLLKAYLDGEFINLTSGSVYPYFSRETHHKDDFIIGNETLYIGQDFNYNASVSIVFVKRGDNLVAVDEIVSKDTKGVVDNIKNRYPLNYINVYPDASGNANKTSASETDIAILRKGGFNVFVNHSNPRVKDRINIVNNSFEKNIVFVNTKSCKKLTESLEQQAYDVKTGEPEKFSEHPSVDDYNDSFSYCIAYLNPINARMVKAKMTGY